MNAKQVVGSSLALVFSTLMMACASEAVDEAAPAAEESTSASELASTTDDGVNAAPAPTTDAVQGLYCEKNERLWDKGGCRDKDWLVSGASKYCEFLGFKTMQKTGEVRDGCPSPKLGAIRYKCCDIL